MPKSLAANLYNPHEQSKEQLVEHFVVLLTSSEVDPLRAPDGRSLTAAGPTRPPGACRQPAPCACAGAWSPLAG